MRWYRPSFSHRSSIFGSAVGRLAFIEKLVFGRLTVCFKSTLCESIGGVNTMLPVARPTDLPRNEHRVPQIGQPLRREHIGSKTRLARRQNCTKCAKMLTSAMDVTQVKPYRVLVCDDQADVLEALRLLLKGRGLAGRRGGFPAKR